MDREEKLQALRHIGMTMQADVVVVSVLSFLAGRLDRVHFVADVEGASIAAYFSLHSRLWPRVPFRAEIDGTPVSHPLAFIERAALRDEDVYVQVDFAGSDPPEWYKAVLEESVQDARQYIEASMARVRSQIDMALDVYRTANDALVQADEEKQAYLRFALQRARDDIKSLSSRLQELESQLD